MKAQFLVVAVFAMSVIVAQSFSEEKKVERNTYPVQSHERPVPIQVETGTIIEITRNYLRQNPEKIAILITRGKSTPSGVTPDEIAEIVIDRFIEVGAQIQPFINDGDKNKETSVIFIHGFYAHGPLNGAEALRQAEAFAVYEKEKNAEKASNGNAASSKKIPPKR